METHQNCPEQEASTNPLETPESEPRRPVLLSLCSGVVFSREWQAMHRLKEGA